MSYRPNERINWWFLFGFILGLLFCVGFWGGVLAIVFHFVWKWW